MKKFLKVALMTFLIILCTFSLIIIVINSSKFFIYREYFNVASELEVNEGLGDGYVPQGVAKIKDHDEDIYISSGYMCTGSPSRIYVIKSDKSYYVEVKISDYELTTARFGGIAVAGDSIFVAGDGKVFVLRLKDVLDAEYESLTKPEQNDIKVTNIFKTDLKANYIYTDTSESYLYVGEFNGDKEIKVNDGKDVYHSYVSKYLVGDVRDNKDAKPLVRFVVRDIVQGFAISEDKIVLSTSKGLSNSHLYVYNIPTSFDDSKNKTYYLDDRYLTKSVTAPAMAQALDYDGKYFITLYESASNQYIFGKFFFANKIVGLSL